MTNATEIIKKKIGLIQQILDIVRQMFGIQTQLEKLQTEQMVRRIAANYKVDVEVLVATIKCESGMNPKAVNKNPNGTIDYGLCQFNDYWYGNIISPKVALNQPEVAVNVMCQQWEKGRQSDWICHRNKKYTQYLNV